MESRRFPIDIHSVTLIILTSISESLPAKLASIVIAAVSGYLFRILKDRTFLTLPLRSLFRIRNPSSTRLVIGSPWGIIPETSELHKNKGMPIFGFGPLFAFHILCDKFCTAYPHEPSLELVTSDTFNNQELNRDLILLGWPQGNRITSKILNAKKLPFRWQDHSFIIDGSNPQIFTPTYQNGEVKTDYGVIIQLPNPFGDNTYVTIFSGCETFGVKAAAEFFEIKNFHYFRNIENGPITGLILACIDRYWPSRWKPKGAVLIVKTEVTGLFTTPPKLVYKFSLK